MEVCLIKEVPMTRSGHLIAMVPQRLIVFHKVFVRKKKLDLEESELWNGKEAFK
jgi:hypothetical protein